MPSILNSAATLYALQVRNAYQGLLTNVTAGRNIQFKKMDMVLLLLEAQMAAFTALTEVAGATALTLKEVTAQTIAATDRFIYTTLVSTKSKSGVHLGEGRGECGIGARTLGFPGFYALLVHILLTSMGWRQAVVFLLCLCR